MGCPRSMRTAGWPISLGSNGLTWPGIVTGRKARGCRDVRGRAGWHLSGVVHGRSMHNPVWCQRNATLTGFAWTRTGAGPRNPCKTPEICQQGPSAGVAPRTTLRNAIAGEVGGTEVGAVPLPPPRLAPCRCRYRSCRCTVAAVEVAAVEVAGAPPSHLQRRCRRRCRHRRRSCCPSAAQLPLPRFVTSSCRAPVRTPPSRCGGMLINQ